MSDVKYLFRLSPGEKMYIGDYNNGNYLTVESDGTMALTGDATVFEDFRVALTSTKLGGSADPDFTKVLDDGSGSTGVFVLLFNKLVEEEVFTAVQLPHRWREGTTLYMHFHWIPIDTDTGDVVWGVEYTTANIDGTFGNTTLATVTDTASGTANTHQMSAAIELDGTGLTASSMILLRLYRDASNVADTYDNDAALIEFDIHFEIDKLGESSF